MNVLKYIINVDLIKTYILINNLTSKKFCEKAGINLKIFKKILKRKLDYIPYAIVDISDYIGLSLDCFLNIALIKKYKLPLFEKDVFTIK